MQTTYQTGVSAEPADHSDSDASECLIAPPVVTDGAARALVMYRRLVQTGFEAPRALNGT